MVMFLRQYNCSPKGRGSKVNKKNEHSGINPATLASALELNPQSDSAFGLTIIILTSILLVAIISTAVIVIVNRDNIIIKSAR